MNNLHHEITWMQYLQDIDLLGNLIEEKEWQNYQIVGLLRGGTIPATMLAYRFKQRPLSIDVSRTIVSDMNNISNIASLGPLLLIDDLIDTGRTLAAVNEALENKNCSMNTVKSAVVYEKRVPRITNTDLFTKSLSDKWVMFPYDVTNKALSRIPSIPEFQWSAMIGGIKTLLDDLEYSIFYHRNQVHIMNKTHKGKFNKKDLSKYHEHLDAISHARIALSSLYINIRA